MNTHTHNEPELKQFTVYWQQHDENGFYSRKRKENFYAPTPEIAWSYAYQEGEHEDDFLISIKEIKNN